MEIKNEKIIIVGGSGSGKDHLKRGLIKLGLRHSPKFTSRPRRELEVHGEDYDFIDKEFYLELQNTNQIKTSQNFIINNESWHYGITKENWNTNQIFIMTPYELTQISDEELKKCFVVYLNIDLQTRKKRIFQRNDNNDSTDRRLGSDTEDFKDFKKYDL